MLDSSVLPLKIFEEAWKGGGKISQASDETRDIDEFSQNHLSQLSSFMIPEEGEWGTLFVSLRPVLSLPHLYYSLDEI